MSSRHRRPAGYLFELFGNYVYRLRCSFQPASRYQTAMSATTPQTALPHPTRLGRKRAEPTSLRSSARTKKMRIAEAPMAKKITATQSLMWPSPALQIEPAPQPPAITIPTPKRLPPRRAPSQKEGKTHSVESFKSVALRIEKPIMLKVRARAAARVCSLSPLMKGSRNARTRQKRER